MAHLLTDQGRIAGPGADGPLRNGPRPGGQRQWRRWVRRGRGRRGAPPERLVVPRGSAPLVLAVDPGMDGEQSAPMIDLDRPLRAPVDLDGPPEGGRWPRITSGRHRHQTSGRDLPAPSGGEAVRRGALMGPQLFLQQRLRRCAQAGPMATLIRHRQHPLLGHGVQAVPTGKLPPHHATALDVLEARCPLALRLRPRGPTHARRAAIIVGEIPALRMPLEPAPIPIPRQHYRLGLVVEHRLGEPTKPVKGVLMTGQQAAQRLIAPTLDIEPPRIAQHQHQSLDAHPLSANMSPGTAPIHLRLTPGGRFKPDGGRCLPSTLGPERSHGPLDHLIAAGIALGLQLLEEPLGIGGHLRHPALDVGPIRAHQRGTGNRPLVWRGAFLGQETPHRLPIDTELAGHLWLRLPAPGAGMDLGPQVKAEHLPLPLVRVWGRMSQLVHGLALLPLEEGWGIFNHPKWGV
jgi:hypothetical protein